MKIYSFTKEALEERVLKSIDIFYRFLLENGVLESIRQETLSLFMSEEEDE